MSGDISFEKYLKLTPLCTGDSIQHRLCNRHICGAVWSQWLPWTPCSKTCGFGGHQIRHRDCAINMPSSQHGFLTSNLPLAQYLKMYGKCEGLRLENRKCSVRVCSVSGKKSVITSPSDGRAAESRKGTPNTAWTDWVSSLMVYQKVTETVAYVISVDYKTKFINLNWNNHLRNPLSTEYVAMSSELEAALDKVMTTFQGYQYSKVIQFSNDESTFKVKRSTASMTFGVYVHFIMVM